MIKTFKNKQLAALWAAKRIIIRLDRLDISKTAENMMLPGFNFHSLSGYNPTRYTVHVNGHWCITFEFANGDAYAIDLEQYH